MMEVSSYPGPPGPSRPRRPPPPPPPGAQGDVDLADRIVAMQRKQASGSGAPPPPPPPRCVSRDLMQKYMQVAADCRVDLADPSRQWWMNSLGVPVHRLRDFTSQPLICPNPLVRAPHEGRHRNSQNTNINIVDSECIPLALYRVVITARANLAEAHPLRMVPSESSLIPNIQHHLQHQHRVPYQHRPFLDIHLHQDPKHRPLSTDIQTTIGVAPPLEDRKDRLLDSYLILPNTTPFNSIAVWTHPLSMDPVTVPLVRSPEFVPKRKRWTVSERDGNGKKAASEGWPRRRITVIAKVKGAEAARGVSRTGSVARAKRESPHWNLPM